MTIDEIIRTCASESVAASAVRCLGSRFHAEMEVAGQTCGTDVGSFAAFAVKRFARLGDEAEMRLVRNVMDGAQEPVLVGLRQILRGALAATVRCDYPRRSRNGESLKFCDGQWAEPARGDERVL